MVWLFLNLILKMSFLLCLCQSSVSMYVVLQADAQLVLVSGKSGKRACSQSAALTWQPTVMVSNGSNTAEM